MLSKWEQPWRQMRFSSARDKTLLVVTKGFRDQLRIAYQARPRLFDKEIILPEMLYDRIEEVI